MISIITVCHKSSAHVARYVDSVIVTIPRAHRSAIEFIFVNNSDDPELAERVEALRTAGFKALRLEMENRGFGAGCNLGAAEARGDTLIFMNPDATAKTDLSKFALPDGTHWGTCRQHIGGGRYYSFDVLPEMKGYAYDLLRFYRHSDALFGIGFAPRMYVVGSFLAVRAEAFRCIGGFDESFFLYYEEADLGRRLGQKYGRPGFDKLTCIDHIGFGSEPSREFTFREEARSFVIYANKIGQPGIIAKRLRMLNIRARFSAGEKLRERMLLEAARAPRPAERAL